MHRFAPVALATILAATAPARAQAQNGIQPRAQAPTPFTVPQPTGRFTDPANLAGERVRPRDGRELPINGGLGANGQPDNALGLAQMLRRLNTRASLMLIVAHPDDEDGGMLTYYSRGLGARVAILTLNRGEGGQNEMTGDFDDALGLLRTQELLSADRYMGVDQMFGTEVDFGFTKTKAEAFQKWNHQRVLYDAVRAVRIYRPLVIASVFSGAVTDGHGQHQVSGQIAQEVFKAAGDPNVFPELTREGILPWQPLKVYARVPFSRVTDKGLYDYATGQTVPAEFTNYVTGQTFTTEPTPDVTINEGDTDPLLSTCSANPADLPASLRPTSSATRGCEPLSYVQFARIGLGLQRSQIGGGDRISRAGRVDVGYHLYGSFVCGPGLPNPTPGLCTPHFSAAKAKAPTARSIPAQGNALGKADRGEPSAEGAPYNPALTHQPSFFDGIDTSIGGIGGMLNKLSVEIRLNLDKLDHTLQRLSDSYDLAHPDRSAPALAKALAQTDSILSAVHSSKINDVNKAQIIFELDVKRAQLNEALSMALGLSLDATSQTSNLVAGENVSFHTHLAESSSVPVSFFNEEIKTPFDPWHDIVRLGTIPPAVVTLDKDFSITISSHPAHISRPYFTRPNEEQPYYDLVNPSLRNAPSTPSSFVASATVIYQGQYIHILRVVHSGPQPVQIIPPVSLTLDRNAQVIPDGTHSLNLDVHTETEDHPQGDLRLQAPTDWTIRSPQRPLRAGTESFSTSLPAPLNTSTLRAEATISNTTYTEGFRAVGYGNLPRTNFYTPATLRVVPVDLKLPTENKRRIAYLPGTGDDVPAALASIGLNPTILKVSDLTPEKLKAFDTVVLGVRTYNAHPDLHGAPTHALLDFARSGGNVVVQYQTPEFTAADAPYPLVDHNERVIDETAPVVLLTTENSKLKTDPQTESAESLLTTPNKITPADFNNWIEERGHGFLDTWDPHYTALTETHDPGAPAEHILPQSPQRGGLITTPLGKGRWTYCAFALYRQLPEAVPGAFRLFVNLLNP
ncbi:MAG TPA: PIG-L family deacetylase [Acidobacteriaceae bacterium]|nr:PIG-L family deacetylase [Acidobacteriaceae bacterium]